VGEPDTERALVVHGQRVSAVGVYILRSWLQNDLKAEANVFRLLPPVQIYTVDSYDPGNIAVDLQSCL